MVAPGDRQDRRGPAAADGDRHVAGEPHEAGAVSSDISRRLALAEGLTDDAGARAGEGGQGGRLDRRRPARHRDARRAAARPDGLPDGQPHRRGDDAVPRRRASSCSSTPTRTATISSPTGTCATRSRSSAALAEPAAALPEVHRPRQQPRLLRLDAGRDREHQPRALPRVVPADSLQPPPERPGRARSSGRRRCATPTTTTSIRCSILGLQALGTAHAHAAGGRGQARRDDGVGRRVRRLVERRHPQHRQLPQHHRDPDRDDRQPDADADSARARSGRFPNRDLPLPDRAAGVALPAVDRLLDVVQPRGASTTRRASARTCSSTSTGWGSARSSAAAGTPGRRRRRGSARSPRRCGGGGRGGDAERDADGVGGAAQARACAIRARYIIPSDQPRFPDRDEVHQRAARGRTSPCSARRATFAGRRQDVSGRLVRRDDGAGVPAARDRHVRAAGSSRRDSLSRRAADAAVRQRRLDARVSRWACSSIACSSRSPGRSSRSPTGTSRRRRAASSRRRRHGVSARPRARTTRIVAVNRLLAAGRAREPRRRRRSTSVPPRRQRAAPEGSRPISASAFRRRERRAGGTAAARAARRPLGSVRRLDGLRLDALDPRAVRVPVRARLRAGARRRQPQREVRRAGLRRAARFLPCRRRRAAAAARGGGGGAGGPDPQTIPAGVPRRSSGA